MNQENIYLDAWNRAIKARENEFVKRGLIPLGVDRRNKPVCMKYDPRDTFALGIISLAGYGKSVLLKRIYGYIFRSSTKRPGIIFDLQGADHNLSRFANTQPYPLFNKYGERAFALSSIINYAPHFVGDEAHPFDKKFGFDLKVLVQSDLRTIMLGSEASVNEMYNLFRENEDLLEDPQKIFQYLNKAPTSANELKKNLNYDTVINPNIKNSIIRNFGPLIEDEVFIPTKSKEYKDSFYPEMLKGKIVVLNFHQVEEYVPVYTGVILRDVFLKRRTDIIKDPSKKYTPGPTVIIEEAQLSLSRDHDGTSAVRAMINILRTGRKYNFQTIMVTQDVTSLHPQIKHHTREWIIGSLVGADYNYFKQIFSKEVMYILENLDTEPSSWGSREWAYVYSNGKKCKTFYPYNSMLEINRGGGNR